MYGNRVQWTRFLCRETEFNNLGFYTWKPSTLNSVCVHGNRVRWTWFLGALSTGGISEDGAVLSFDTLCLHLEKATLVYFFTYFLAASSNAYCNNSIYTYTYIYIYIFIYIYSLFWKHAVLKWPIVIKWGYFAISKAQVTPSPISASGASWVGNVCICIEKCATGASLIIGHKCRHVQKPSSTNLVSM